jgi:hypothetical protein
MYFGFISACKTLNPLEIISKVVKIQNHPRHKIDFIASGLDPS